MIIIILNQLFKPFAEVISKAAFREITFHSFSGFFTTLSTSLKSKQ